MTNKDASTAPVFFVGGKTVNGKGQEVGDDGQVKAQDSSSVEADLREQVEDLALDLGKMTEERDEYRQLFSESQSTGADALAKVNSTYEADKAEWAKERQSLLNDTAAALEGKKTAETERDAAQTALTAKAAELEGQTALPADALERLKSVDGIGEKMAQKALDALTASPIGK